MTLSPTQPVQTTTTQVQAPQAGSERDVFSFDDLDASTGLTPEEGSSSGQEAKVDETSGDDGGTEDSLQSADEQAQAGDGDTGDGATASADQGTGDTGDAAGGKPAPAPRETIKTVEGQDIDLSTKIRKKVDGEMREITLKEVIDTYAGKYAVEKRFADANKLKQQVEHQQRQQEAQFGKAKTTIAKFFEATKAGYYRDALDALCELTGADPNKAWDDFKSSQIDAGRRLSALTPEARAQAEKDQETEYWKRRATTKPAEADDSSPAKVEEKLNVEASKYGLSQGDLNVAWGILRDLQDKGVHNEDIADGISVDAVIKHARNFKIWRDIDSACQEHLPEKVGNSAFYNEILADTQKYGLTKEDWVSLITELKSSPKPGTTTAADAKRAQKKAFTGQGNVAPTQTRKSNDQDIYSFDDL